MSERRRISSGSRFERDIGYSRAVVDGDWIFVSGTTGFDYATMTISEDVAEQAEQALAHHRECAGEAGASLDDVVRVRYLLPSADDFEACWPVLRRHFGVALPAATMMVAGARRSPHEDRDRGHRPRAFLMAARNPSRCVGIAEAASDVDSRGHADVPAGNDRGTDVHAHHAIGAIRRPYEKSATTGASSCASSRSGRPSTRSTSRSAAGRSPIRAHALADAWRVIGWERSLGLFHEVALQQLLEPLDGFFSTYYMLGFGPVIASMLVWLAGSRAGALYRELRTLLFISLGDRAGRLRRVPDGAAAARARPRHRGHRRPRRATTAAPSRASASTRMRRCRACTSAGACSRRS